MYFWFFDLSSRRGAEIADEEEFKQSGEQIISLFHEWLRASFVVVLLRFPKPLRFHLHRFARHPLPAAGSGKTVFRYRVRVN
jgi:hypothetical protein